MKVAIIGAGISGLTFQVASPGQTETAAKVEALETDIITRGRRAVLDPRATARRFHVTNRLQQRWRNVGFRVGNTFMQLVSRDGKCTARALAELTQGRHRSNEG